VRRRTVPSASTSARRRDLAEIVAVADIGIEESALRKRGLKRRRDLDRNIDIFIDAASHAPDGEPLSRMVISDIGNRTRWHDPTTHKPSRSSESCKAITPALHCTIDWYRCGFVDAASDCACEHIGCKHPEFTERKHRIGQGFCTHAR